MEPKLKMLIVILVIFAVFDSCWAMEKKKGKQRKFLRVLDVYRKEDSTYQRNLKHSFQF